MTNNHTILIVDDDQDTRNIIKTIVSAKGYNYVEAKDGKTALKILEDQNITLILLDIMMPEMSGYDVMVHLKTNSHTQSIPVIMLTAKGEDEDIMSGYNQYSVDYYITKPFTPKTLLNGIELTLAAV